jgi:hypothetical protein
MTGTGQAAVFVQHVQAIQYLLSALYGEGEEITFSPLAWLWAISSASSPALEFSFLWLRSL